MPGAIFENLDVNLRGNTSNIDRALTGTQAKVAGFSRAVNVQGGAVTSAFGKINQSVTGSLGSLGSSLAGMASSVGAMLAGAFAVSKIGEALGDVARFGRLAERLGVTTDAFQALAVGARLSGLEIEEFDHNVLKLERHISEAARGQGEAGKVFEELKLSAHELNNLGADQQLSRIAGALQKVGNQGDRLRILVALFGREGASMARFFRDGSQGIDGFAERARQFGLIISADGVAAAQRAKHAWRDFGLALDGVSRNLAVLLAPAIEFVGRYLADNTARVSRWLNAFSQFGNVVSAFFQMFKPLIDAVLQPFDLGRMFMNLTGFEANADGIRKALIRVEFQFLHWREIMGLGIDLLQLAWLQFTNTFGEVWDRMLGRMENRFTSFWASIASILGRGAAIVGGAQLQPRPPHIPSPDEIALIKRIALASAALHNDLDRFMEERLRGGQGGRPPSLFTGSAVGAGAHDIRSADAFKIIAGDQTDRMYNAINNGVLEQRRTNEILRAINHNPDNPFIPANL